MRNRELATEIKKQLGEKLKLERARLGLSIVDLYFITGWDYGDISNFENNRVNEDMLLSKYVAIAGLIRAMELHTSKSGFMRHYRRTD